jgi:membrane associated rhomboid family serine protease
MFIPLHDANHLKRIDAQYVTIGLIAANVIVWFMTGIGMPERIEAATIGLGYIPSTIYDIQERADFQVWVPDYATYVTYMFLHGDFWHLAGNMLFLWVFGDNVEDALGHLRFLAFYLICGIAGAFLHGIVAPASEAPLIGASGAIAGVVAAYLMLHPRVRIWVLVLMRIPLRLPAWIVIVLWIGFQFVMFLISLSSHEEEISWSAHVGGIIAGAVLVLFMRQRNVPLFDTEVVTPRAAEVRLPPPLPPPAAPPLDPGPPEPRWGRR